jgi:hypothetical protein
MRSSLCENYSPHLLTQASGSGTEQLNIDEHCHVPGAELWAEQWVFSSFKKTLDSSGIKSIIRIFLRYQTEEQEVIMTSKANYFITADLVNIHTPVT